MMMQAVAAFVARGPTENRRMVFVPLVGTHHALHIGFFPFRQIANPCFGMIYHIVAIVAGGAADEAVGFNICFQKYIKAHFIAHIQKLWCGWIMGGADAIDVELFHLGKIISKIAVGHRPTFGGMCVMVIHALELNRRAVDTKSTRFVDGIRNKTDLAANGFFLIYKYKCVQIGLFRIPKNGGVYGKYCCVGSITFLQKSILVIKADMGRAFHSNFDLIVLRCDMQVADVPLGTGEKIHITENAVHAEKVLIL